MKSLRISLSLLFFFRLRGFVRGFRRIHDLIPQSFRLLTALILSKQQNCMIYDLVLSAS